MSTFLIIGSIASVWSSVCIVILAACVAARRGDEAVPGSAG